MSAGPGSGPEGAMAALGAVFARPPRRGALTPPPLTTAASFDTSLKCQLTMATTKVSTGPPEKPC